MQWSETHGDSVMILLIERLQPKSEKKERRGEEVKLRRDVASTVYDGEDGGRSAIKTESPRLYSP